MAGQQRIVRRLAALGLALGAVAAQAGSDVTARVVAVSPERLWRAVAEQPELDPATLDTRRYTGWVRPPGAPAFRIEVDWDERSGGARLQLVPAGAAASAWAERVAQRAEALPHINKFCRGPNPDLSIPEPSVEAAKDCGYGNFSSAVHELEKCGDHETTLLLLAACVKHEHAAGLLRIAQLYETGMGLPQRPERMADYMARAARSGPPAYGRAARVQYATALYFGEGVPADRPAALALFRTAAAEGDPDARRFLAEGWHAAWRRADGTLFRDPDFRADAAAAR